MGATAQFELRLLGHFSLRCGGRTPEIIAISSKKARALLAYVVMQTPMRAGRERLATLLWPDRIDRQARQNLRACLASLRADLAGAADELLLIDAETVEIKNLNVDARRLRELSRAAADDVAGLYRGQFLADVELESEAFREWALAERAAIDASAGVVLSALAERAQQSGDAAQAIEYASRLIAIDPFREDWFRLSLTITAGFRGRDQALAQARSFIALLKKELDVAPEADTIALLEQIKAGRFVSGAAQTIAVGAALASDADAKSAPSPSSEARMTTPPKPPAFVHRDRRAAIVGAGLLAAGLACLLVVYQPPARTVQSNATTEAADASTIPLRVSPFQSQGADTTGIAAALTESVLTDVSRFSGLTVFDGRLLQNLQKQTAERPFIRLSAWGSVRREGSSMRVRVGLTDAANQSVVWAGDYVEDEPISPGRELPQRIARDLQVQATYAAARDLDRVNISRAPLYQIIAKALTIQYRGSTPGDEAAAAALYKEALRRDPNSALALIGVAARLVASSANLQSERNSALRRAEPLIDRALHVNPWIERAYYWRGNIELERGQNGLALQSFDRALELNPSFLPAEAHAGFALVLAGRTEEGLRRIQNALRQSTHDPNERLWLRFAGIAQLERGNDAEAIYCLLEAASLATPSPLLHAALASAYALMGQRKQSREQFDMLRETANPAAVERLLEAASKIDSQQGSRYWHGLHLAADNS